jgi:hypothetical protein
VPPDEPTTAPSAGGYASRAKSSPPTKSPPTTAPSSDDESATAAPSFPVGSLGKPVLALRLRHVGYDYIMRLHDLSMLLTVGELSAMCNGGAPGNAEPPASTPCNASERGVYASTAPFHNSLMLLGAPVDRLEHGRCMSSIACGEIFRKLDVDGDGRVSLCELQTLCHRDSKVREQLGLAAQRARSSVPGTAPGTSPGTSPAMAPTPAMAPEPPDTTPEPPDTTPEPPDTTSWPRPSVDMEFEAPGAAWNVPRSLPSTCTAMATLSTSSAAGSHFGQGWP